MLHTLNEAWANILINQAIKDTDKEFLFVCKNTEEACKYQDLVANTDKEKVLGYENVCMIAIEDIETWITDIVQSHGEHKMPIFDDILISHELHDPMIKNFLGQHCRRKGA